MSFYLSSALGFFIQLAPCVLMIFLPFPEGVLRIPRRRVLAWAAAAAGALAALFPLALLLLPWFPLTGNLVMLSAIALTLAAFFWLVQEVLIKKVLVFFVVLFYAVTQF